MRSFAKILKLKCDDQRPAVLFLCMLVIFPFDLFSAARLPAMPQQPEVIGTPLQPRDSSVYLDADLAVRLPEDVTKAAEEEDDPVSVLVDEDSPYGLDGKKLPFNPSPTRAVWMSALFPGLGQIYNRRFWKLPIVVGGFMGLGYGVNWTNNQYADYSRAYRDIMDSDPSTNSYMDFFPPTTVESDLDKSWLQSVLKSRRDNYRRNRDLCIICCVALYLLCMLDAYVDASLAHFDISDNLSMDLTPALIPASGSASPRQAALGLQWAFNF